MVAIPPPPPISPANPIFAVIPLGTKFFRIYDPAIAGAGPLTFRTFGPLLRFDHHLPDKDGKAKNDPSRGVLYAGLTLSCCIVEIYGDQRVITVSTRQVAKITTTRQLQLLDLRKNGAMRAGTLAAIAKDADRSLTQNWSRYFYESNAVYGAIDGITWFNAHNDEQAFILFERANDALNCSAKDTRPLNLKALRPHLQRIAQKNNLTIEPY